MTPSASALLKTFSEARKTKSRLVPAKKPPKSATKGVGGGSDTGGGGGDAVAAFETFQATCTRMDEAIAAMEQEQQQGGVDGSD